MQSDRKSVEEAITAIESQVTVSNYMSSRLIGAGVTDIFTVPGDFTLFLLDEFLRQNLKLIGCTCELGAGYAADGSARASNRLGVACVTYMVGSLSLINAVAGAYAEDVSLLIISGSPNSNDGQERRRVHHTLGEIELYTAIKCFAPVTAACYSIRHIKDASEMIDKAIETCLRCKKPVYLEIACNLTAAMVAAPTPAYWDQRSQRTPVAVSSPVESSDPIALDRAVADVAHCLSIATKPVLICGSKLRSHQAQTAFIALARAIGCAVAIMPDAKGQFSEYNEQFVGVYWGSISSPNVAEIVESADLMLFCGPVLNDYTTEGWSALINPKKLITIAVDAVTVGEMRRYGNIHIAEVIQALSLVAPQRPRSLADYRRLSHSSSSICAVTNAMDDSLPVVSGAPLTLAELRERLQGLLTSQSSLIVETGDSWFIGQRMRLPDGARYFAQMQYGSIGWAFGVTLGVALREAEVGRDVITLTGDGAFQMTAQELSTLIRYQVDCTVLLINNGGYTIECQIHDNVYNDIANWKYAALVEVFRHEAAGDSDGRCLGRMVRTAEELDSALAACKGFRGPKLLECCISRDDCTSSLLKWGARVAAANMRM